MVTSEVSLVPPACISPTSTAPVPLQEVTPRETQAVSIAIRPYRRPGVRTGIEKGVSQIRYSIYKRWLSDKSVSSICKRLHGLRNTPKRMRPARILAPPPGFGPFLCARVHTSIRSLFYIPHPDSPFLREVSGRNIVYGNPKVLEAHFNHSVP